MPTSSPSRDRDERQPHRSFTSSSSSMSSSVPPNSLSTNAPLSLDSLLLSHSAAPDPKLAALEQALSERNVLSSQNSQLWKLVEKQRAGYNQILKELERVRNERDSYKARLAADSTHGIAAPDKRGDPRPLRQVSGSSSSPAPGSVPPSKQPLNRYHSDEQVTPRSTSHHHSLHPSRSQEPLSYSPLNAQTSTTLNTLQTSQESVLAASQQLPSHKSSLPALIVPPRSESLPEVSATQESAQYSFRDNTDSTSPQTANSSSSNKYTHYTHGYSDSIMSSLSYSSTQTTPTAYSQKGSINETTNNSGNNIPSSAAGSIDGFFTAEKTSSSHEVPQITTPPSSNLSTERNPQVTFPSSLAPAMDAPLSRDSRITLPDEAKHYIANMSESPFPSPRGDSFNRQAPPSQLSQSHVLPADDREPPTTASSSTGARDTEDHEFLDMRDEEEGDDDDLDGREIADGYEVVDVPPTSTQRPPQSQQDIVTPLRRDSHDVAEEFPLPPSSTSYATHEQPTLKVDPTYQRQNQSAMSAPRLQKPEDTGMPQEPAPASATGFFRALPLLPTDLPHTKINVSHSFVRPNDRGKEVLSFMVHVFPGNGKEGWKVEKMYSDVLSLDQRVRNSVGKGIGKKIASLPEGKLWKDHAPAKVDQRKAVLENYLQTLINLPVKNNDEVIAFFTSDIVKETMQPVMQAGHKEGYLTKRGKNFGGWKTRYFVLQGPVLEYFDCRGGTHLGSIAVTGAQIGRQQRNAGSGVTDEEKEYRHAFLIVEAKKGPGGNHPRHVLCAESDAERDSWVEILVRYFSGTYSEEPVAYGSAPPAANGTAPGVTQPPREPRTSISNDNGSSKKPSRGFSRDDISISKGAAVPLSQLPQDANNAKLFQGVVNLEEYSASSSPSKPVDISNDRSPVVFSDSQTAKRILERGQGQPSSLPDSSPISNQSPAAAAEASQQRANSELGHYPDMQSSRQRHQSPERHRVKDPHKNVPHTTSINLNSSPTTSSPSDRVPSPEKMDNNSKVKISGPLNGAPIPAGYKFGGKDAPTEPSSTPNDRREKAKSRSFWGFGRPNGPEKTAPVYIPRAVFGVTLEEALDVAQIANLPAIVFRCIQYLEAKKADQEEGIYRLSGSSAVIKNLKDRFNAEGDVDLLASDEYWDPHAIAGLLKSFLRELPASILTRDLHLRFLAVIDFVDPQERIKELSQLIASLPLANYSLLRALTAHLILIVQNSAVNKMTMRNVGIVFSPTLGIPAGVFSLMLGEFNRVFNVDVDDSTTGSTKVDNASSDNLTSDHKRRNSRQYSEAAADQLLGLAGRTLTTPAEEGQSDTDDFSSVQEESGTEADAATESSSNHGQVRISPPDTPMANQSRASGLAASRGLNISITRSERGNRHSRMMGLPTSPRPPGSPSYSSSSSPTPAQ
ncbi:RhoGAP-domain-containing protein [Dendrothele bispora CBS 962.96]|uniref:RhoGAP-domain-containing protein n=1 Tax=Dendrothele bispora (strain CBS 962.96) TaxID=1314807 RepID=A0A4S8LI25_DENBC|nr:RhoGAP-domain-containing protein [Dendrothele bispora CBS 962.96]